MTFFSKRFIYRESLVSFYSSWELQLKFSIEYLIQLFVSHLETFLILWLILDEVL